MKAIAKNGRAKMRNGRATTCSDDCCGECATWWKATHCPNPGTCVPYVCDIYVCQTAVCCDGSVPPEPIVVGSVIQFHGWCYTVQSGDIPASAIPPGAVRVTTADFCSGDAFCIPGNCSHPACNCPPGPWLYWQACPCPDGAGGPTCRVISLDDYGRLSRSIGSECVVADFGEDGCHYVSLRSPQASTLPPGCIVAVPALGTVGPTCCECCVGCAFSRITGAQCASIRELNPKWSCTPIDCCCQRLRFEWSLHHYFRPADPLVRSFTITFSGGATVDLVANPFGIIVPVVLTVTYDDGDVETINSDMELRCGTQNVIPAGMNFYYALDLEPIAEGSSGDYTWTQSGNFGCSNYAVDWRRTRNLAPPFQTEIAETNWRITATPAGGSTATCGRGCSGNYVRPAAGPCDPDPVPAGEGTEAFL